MKKNMRNRVALLGALLVAGLVLAGIGTAFGAGAVFQEKPPLRLEAISEGDIVRIVTFRDSVEVGTYNMSGGGGGAISIVSSTSSGEIMIGSEPRLAMVGTYTGGDIYTKLSEEQRCKAIEIAKRNETVQEILEGAENYHITVYDVMKMEEIEKEGKGRGIKLVHEEDKARVEIRVFKEYEDEKRLKEYSVIVDLAKEEVTEINEHPEIRKAKWIVRAWEGNVIEIELVKEEAVKIALNDSRVQELIEGKEYQVFGVGTVGGIGSADRVALGLGIEEKGYTIWVDMKNQTVTSIEEQSGGVMQICVGPGCENVNLTDFTVGVGEMPAMGIGRAVQVNLSELRLEIITCEKNLTEEEKTRAKEIALSDSRVQERTEGKEYKIRAINAHMLSQITGECELLGASVFIDLPEIGKWFNVNVDLEEGKVTHIGPLLPIPKPPGEQ